MLRPVLRFTATVVALACAALLSGCGGGEGADAFTLRGSALSGAGAGAVPLANATVTLYRTRGDATAAIAEATTDATGAFVVNVPDPGFDGFYYVVVRRGSVELATVLGTALPPRATINEMTTVATAYALNAFLQGSAIAGPPQSLSVAAGMANNLVDAATGTPSAVMQRSPNADETNAWRSLGTLANLLAACVRDAPNACAALFALSPSWQGGRPTTTLQSIQNIARDPGGNVTALFALAETVKAFAPALTALQGPASPDPLQKLDAFTLAVKFNASGSASCPFGGPAKIAFDRNGYAWINVNVVQGQPTSASCMIVLKPDGRPADGVGGSVRSPVTGGGLKGAGFGIGIDTGGRVWVGNFGWGQDNPAAGGVSVFAANGTAVSLPPSGYVGGTFRVQGVAADAASNLWLASYGTNAVVVFPNGAEAHAVPYANADSVEPFGVVIGRDGSAFVTYTKSSNLAKFTFAGGTLARVFSLPVGAAPDNPKGLAIDSQNNVWVAAGKTSSLYAYTAAGAPLGTFTGGSLYGPWDVNIDPHDNVWVANFGTEENLGERYRVTRLCGVTASWCPPGKKTGDAISPPSGYTLPSAGSPVLLASGEPLYGAGAPPSYKPLMRSTSVNVDMAANVWYVNNWKPSGLNDIAGNPGGDGVVVFVGLAAPERAPALGPSQSP